MDIWNIIILVNKLRCLVLSIRNPKDSFFFLLSLISVVFSGSISSSPYLQIYIYQKPETRHHEIINTEMHQRSRSCSCLKCLSVSIVIFENKICVEIILKSLFKIFLKILGRNTQWLTKWLVEWLVEYHDSRATINF